MRMEEFGSEHFAEVLSTTHIAQFWFQRSFLPVLSPFTLDHHDDLDFTRQRSILHWEMGRLGLPYSHLTTVAAGLDPNLSTFISRHPQSLYNCVSQKLLPWCSVLGLKCCSLFITFLYPSFYNFSLRLF